MKKVYYAELLGGYEVKLYALILHTVFFLILSLFSFSSFQNIESGEYIWNMLSSPIGTALKTILILFSYPFVLYKYLAKKI